MQITMMRTADLKPYHRNPRMNQEAVLYVAESIQEFGFKFPILIDKQGFIISGHTRLKAAESLGMNEVPCIQADDLTKAQADALRLVDNKSSEQAEWDQTLLDQEVNKLSKLFDMEKFKFDVPKISLDVDLTPQNDPETPEGEEMETDGPEGEDVLNWASETQDKVENILNLGIAQFPGTGLFDIPSILPTHEVPEVDEWIGFNYALGEKNPETKGVHFFLDDYQFERIWNRPMQYVEVLQRFKCVLAPDFSPYGDMPLVTQMFNHYRKHWCARLWQENGITVYPTIRASTDPRSQGFYLDGEPEHAVLAFSTMWATQYEEETKAEFQQMIDELNPSHLLIYGKEMPFVTDSGIPFTRIPSFSEMRWEDG